ncbi:hypothetical protein [Bosea sp. ANAM02]|uniref:hypothetical protein n=1 Tax=Bosea sp. ANAM02 TaxID=2020412 RepID=UPI00140ED31C|nr:hypothetical protein [Bosea sp. ANAM02]BCB22387.1 hypothetical protein OCUBac02_52810 [Bosea sp. ANAM02]
MHALSNRPSALWLIGIVLPLWIVVGFLLGWGFATMLLLTIGALMKRWYGWALAFGELTILALVFL